MIGFALIFIKKFKRVKRTRYLDNSRWCTVCTHTRQNTTHVAFPILLLSELQFLSEISRWNIIRDSNSNLWQRYQFLSAMVENRVLLLSAVSAAGVAVAAYIYIYRSKVCHLSAQIKDSFDFFKFYSCFINIFIKEFFNFWKMSFSSYL